MHIKEIRWIDKACYEADVVVSDGNICAICFAQPLLLSLNDQVTDIHSIDTQDVMRSDIKIGYITLLTNGYQEICGQLKNVLRRSVQVGQLYITIDDDCIPKDIQTNEFIVFVSHSLRIF